MGRRQDPHSSCLSHPIALNPDTSACECFTNLCSKHVNACVLRKLEKEGLKENKCFPASPTILKENNKQALKQINKQINKHPFYVSQFSSFCRLTAFQRTCSSQKHITSCYKFIWLFCFILIFRMVYST